MANQLAVRYDVDYISIEGSSETNWYILRIYVGRQNFKKWLLTKVLLLHAYLDYSLFIVLGPAEVGNSFPYFFSFLKLLRILESL